MSIWLLNSLREKICLKDWKLILQFPSSRSLIFFFLVFSFIYFFFSLFSFLFLFSFLSFFFFSFLFIFPFPPPFSFFFLGSNCCEEVVRMFRISSCKTNRSSGSLNQKQRTLAIIFYHLVLFFLKQKNRM